MRLPDVTIVHPDPHCVVWIMATASLWGMVDGHDLDEPVKLSEDVPVRLSYGGGHCCLIDRDLALKTTQAGHHAALRFYFRSGAFREIELDGVSSVTNNSVAEVRR